MNTSYKLNCFDCQVSGQTRRRHQNCPTCGSVNIDCTPIHSEDFTPSGSFQFDGSEIVVANVASVDLTFHDNKFHDAMKFLAIVAACAAAVAIAMHYADNQPYKWYGIWTAIVCALLFILIGWFGRQHLLSIHLVGADPILRHGPPKVMREHYDFIQSRIKENNVRIAKGGR